MNNNQHRQHTIITSDTTTSSSSNINSSLFSSCVAWFSSTLSSPSNVIELFSEHGGTVILDEKNPIITHFFSDDPQDKITQQLQDEFIMMFRSIWISHCIEENMVLPLNHYLLPYEAVPLGSVALGLIKIHENNHMLFAQTERGAKLAIEKAKHLAYLKRREYTKNLRERQLAADQSRTKHKLVKEKQVKHKQIESGDNDENDFNSDNHNISAQPFAKRFKTDLTNNIHNNTHKLHTFPDQHESAASSQLNLIDRAYETINNMDNLYSNFLSDSNNSTADSNLQWVGLSGVFAPNNVKHINTHITPVLSARVLSVENSLHRLDNKLESVAKRVDDNLAALEHKLSTVAATLENRVSAVDRKFSAVDSKLSHIAQHIEAALSRK
jgi:archaellum component FlaC